MTSGTIRPGRNTGTKTDKIKVLHVVGKMHPGGIETLLMNLYRNTDRDRYEYHFAVQTEEDAFYDDEIRALGGTIVRQPHPQKGLRRFRAAFENNVRQYGPYDAVHSHIFGFSGYVLKLAENLGIPVRISHSHNTHDSRRTSLARKIYRAYMRRLILRHSTAMLGCSRAACQSLFGTDCWRDGRVRVFPNAIQLSPYESLPAKREELRRRLGAEDPTAPLFGHIGRFSEQKNHAFLIEAFAAFAAKRPDARLVLVGDGPLRASIERTVQERGLAKQVSFLGLRKDVPEILGALDGFVLPSLYEGLGIVLIEAQAAGVPCLVSDRVPEEADLKLGMVDKLPLEAPAERWAEGMSKLAAAASPDWAAVRDALIRHEYDITGSVRRLERVYAGGSFD